MYQDQRTLVVVPARGGSKGVPLKNLHELAGRPLIAHVAKLLAELDWVDRAVVSTDHPDIAAVAHDAGLDAPFFRPEALSGDRIGDVPVLQHALETMETLDGCRYDIIVMLQPTSPLRTAEQVTATVARLIEGGHDAVWTVSPTDLKYHPLKQLTLDEQGRMQLRDRAGHDIIARQQLEPIYHRNGAAYALSRGCLVDTGTLLGENAAAVVIEEPMISIDTAADFARVEAILAERQSVNHTSTAADGGQRTFVVDIDGVLATLVADNDYRQSGPIHGNIAIVNALYAAGHRIILFTARGSATGRDWRELTRSQLAAWGVNYHALHFGKPAADFYIDDRLITLAEAAKFVQTENLDTSS